MGPQKYITESEARVIMNDMFLEYEKDFGGKRHGENQEKFDKLFAAYNRLTGVGLIFVLLKLIDLFSSHAK